MAKNKEKVSTKKQGQGTENEQEEKSPGFFQKIFILGIIPTLFLVTVLLIISTFTSFNVFEKSKDMLSFLPFISSEEDETLGNTKEKIVSLQAEIKQKEAQYEKLKAQLDAAKSENETLLKEQQNLQFEIDKLKRAQEQATMEFAGVLTTYENMDPQSSAPVLVQMGDTQAVNILSQLDPKTVADILSVMSPADAAKYTELMSR